MVGARLHTDYDYERDDGRLERCRLVFDEVLAFEYRDCSCCEAGTVLGASVMRVESQSSFLDTIRSRWTESVGWQDWQKAHGGSARFKHYSIYFDDAGCLDVIASNWEALTFDTVEPAQPD